MQQVALSKADDVEGEHERELQPGSTFGMECGSYRGHTKQTSASIINLRHHSSHRRCFGLERKRPIGAISQDILAQFFSVLHGDRPADRAPRRSQALPQSGCVTTGHQNKRSGNACLTRRL